MKLVIDFKNKLMGGVVKAGEVRKRGLIPEEFLSSDLKGLK